MGDRDVVIRKRLEPPAVSVFAALTARARRAANQAGLTRADVAKAETKVRRTK